MPNILTLIIPTYNMEAYLHRCLSSLVVDDNDLMAQLEVLVIIDGATDRSSEIANEYAHRYPATFRVIDKENGNYGSCINRGLKEATGKYIKVLDADDWFETSQFEKYLGHLCNTDVDLVINDMDRVTSPEVQKSIWSCNVPSFKVCDVSVLSSDYNRMWMHSVAYRTELLRLIEYRQTEGISYTDQEWIFLPLSVAKKLYYIPGILYHYLVGRDGQTVSLESYKKNFWMEMDGLRVMIDEYKSVIDNNTLLNGIPVNVDYLRARLLTRTKFVYYRILSTPVMNHYLDKLVEMDQYIRVQLPELYKAAEDIHYPYKKNSIFLLQTRHIRVWHHHGLRMCRLMLRASELYYRYYCRVALLVRPFREEKFKSSLV